MVKYDMLSPRNDYKKTMGSVVKDVKKKIRCASRSGPPHTCETVRVSVRVWKDAEKIMKQVSKDTDLDKSFLVRITLDNFCFSDQPGYDFLNCVLYPVVIQLGKRYTELKNQNYKFSKRAYGNKNKVRRIYVLSKKSVEFIDELIKERHFIEKSAVDVHNENTKPKERKKYFKINRSDVIREIMLFYFCGGINGIELEEDYPKASSIF